MLGYASVNRMLDEVSSLEIAEWRAYFELKKRYAEEDVSAESAKRRAREYRS